MANNLARFYKMHVQYYTCPVYHKPGIFLTSRVPIYFFLNTNRQHLAAISKRYFSFLSSFFVPYLSLLFEGSMQAVQMQANATQGAA
jgi:hypothetical protein